MLIDSHCHIAGPEFAGDLDQVIARARDAGVARAFVILACFGSVMAPVGAQTAWMLRPFFGRPAEAHVPFFRARESSFLDSVSTSARSSVGIYDRDRRENAL